MLSVCDVEACGVVVNEISRTRVTGVDEAHTPTRAHGSSQDVRSHVHSHVRSFCATHLAMGRLAVVRR